MSLDVRRVSLLSLDFLDSVLEIVRLEVEFLHAGHEEGRFGEEVLHLFEWALGRFRKESPEEYRIGQITHLRMESAVSEDREAEQLTTKRM